MSLADLAGLGAKAPAREHPPDSPFREAIVARTPATTTEGLYVTIASFDRTKLWGPAPWSAKVLGPDTYATPSAGDYALVVVSEENEVWVVEWWPQEYER